MIHAPFERGPADQQLQVDQSLLDGLPGHGTVDAVFRTYRFEPSSITIGRFQEPHDFRAFGVPIARRRTGGGAIWHHDECTFAVAGPAKTLGQSIETLFETVHGALVLALRDVGVAATMVDADGPAPHPRARGVDWCFAKACRFDLVAPDGRKLVGGAQRRIRQPSERVLIHGSIPWTRPPGQDFCATIADQRDPDEIRDELPDRFFDRLLAALRLPTDR